MSELRPPASRGWELAGVDAGRARSSQRVTITEQAGDTAPSTRTVPVQVFRDIRSAMLWSADDTPSAVAGFEGAVAREGRPPSDRRTGHATRDAPCYLPRDGVQKVQVVSIVARAFTKATDLCPTGFWDRFAADPAQYTNVGTEGTQRSDLTTYRMDAGEIPGQGDSATFNNPTANGTRLFVIQVLYQAYNAQYGIDRVQ